MVETGVRVVTPVGKGRVVVANGGVENGGVSISVPLAEGVGDHGAGTDGESSAVAVLLLEESGGWNQSGDLVDSALQVSVVSGLSLVSSDRDGDGQIGGGHVSLQSEGLDGRHDVRVGVGSVGVGVDQNLRLSRPLAVVGHGGDESSSAGTEADVSTALLLLDGQGGHQAGNLVDGAGEVSVGPGHGFVPADRHGDGVAGHHGGMVDGVRVDAVEELGSSMGQVTDGCQQHKGSHLSGEVRRISKL